MKFAQSPLFEPVLWDGHGFKILDELLLPEKIAYLHVDEISQALKAVREMKTRAFGQVLTFLYSGALVAQNFKGKEPESLRHQIVHMTQQFCAARPTFDFKGLGGNFASWLSECPAEVSVGEWVAEKARKFARKIIKARQARAKRTASILPPSARVMTHCNISGELVAVVQHCWEMGKEISIVATETRPYLQGSRLTAWELARAGAPISLIPDCAVAQLMAKGEVNAVVVGSDRCAQNGDIINKVGTYPLAVMAKEHSIPFYVLVQDPGTLARGQDVQIEERPANELLSFHGSALLSDSGDRLGVRYPAFDVTPASMITRLVGFEELFTPESFRERFLKSAHPRVESGEEGGEKYLLVFGVPSSTGYTSLTNALTAERTYRILVPEMRPELWGATVVARELLKRNAPTTLISDSTMGILFAQGAVRQLFFFYSGRSDAGPQGICGSLLAVHLARAHHVPIVLMQSEEAKELAADTDVSTFLGRKVIPPDVSLHPLTDEIVPWTLLNQDRKGQP